jgi:hypothetical protein
LFASKVLLETEENDEDLLRKGRCIRLFLDDAKGAQDEFIGESSSRISHHSFHSIVAHQDRVPPHVSCIWTKEANDFWQDFNNGASERKMPLFDFWKFGRFVESDI